MRTHILHVSRPRPKRIYKNSRHDGMGLVKTTLQREQDLERLAPPPTEFLWVDGQILCPRHKQTMFFRGGGGVELTFYCLPCLEHHFIPVPAIGRLEAMRCRFSRS